MAKSTIRNRCRWSRSSLPRPPRCVAAPAEPLAPFVPVPVVPRVAPAAEPPPVAQAIEPAVPLHATRAGGRNCGAVGAHRLDALRGCRSDRRRAERADRTASSSQSAVRVRSQLLDRLVNQAGEVSITRSRIEADVAQLKASLGDLTDNLERLRRQLRDIELQAETQISSRMEAGQGLAAGVRPARDRPLHARSRN